MNKQTNTWKSVLLADLPRRIVLSLLVAYGLYMALSVVMIGKEQAKRVDCEEAAIASAKAYILGNAATSERLNAEMARVCGNARP